MKKAVWIIDYDFRSNQKYQCPGCPDCDTPIALEDKRYLCIHCGEEVAVDDEEMAVWFKKRIGYRIAQVNCPQCGGKKTMECMQNRNPVTLKWQTLSGVCRKCRTRIFV